MGVPFCRENVTPSTSCKTSSEGGPMQHAALTNGSHPYIIIIIIIIIMYYYYAGAG